MEERSSMIKKSNDTSFSSQRTPLSVRQQSRIIAKMSYNSPNKNKSMDSDKVKRNRKGETPLHTAAIKNDCVKISKIIKEYENVDIFDYAGWTPLLEAANRGNFDAVNLLIKNGANINFKGPYGITPLHDACYNYRYDVIKCLISNGADLNIEDDSGVSCYKHIIKDKKLWDNVSQLPNFAKIFQSNSADIISIDSPSSSSMNSSLSKNLENEVPRSPASSISSQSNKENKDAVHDEDTHVANNLNSTVLSDLDLHIDHISQKENQIKLAMLCDEEICNFSAPVSKDTSIGRNLFETKVELKLSSIESYFAHDDNCMALWKYCLTRMKIGDYLYSALVTLFDDELSGKLCNKYISFNYDTNIYNTPRLQSAIINFREIIIGELLELASVSRFVTRRVLVNHLIKVINQNINEFNERFNAAIEFTC